MVKWADPAAAAPQRFTRRAEAERWRRSIRGWRLETIEHPEGWFLGVQIPGRRRRRILHNDGRII